MDRRPLEGFRVLAVEHFVAAPFGTMWLADAGADVIKIEPPGTGEGGRQLQTFEKGGNNTSLSMLRHNRNKRSVTLNLKSDAGRDVFKRLVTHADAVVSNLAAGAMDRLGLDYETLRAIKPDLVYVASSGFGQARGGSPYSGWPAMDLIAQSMAGLLLRAGQDDDPPTYYGIPLADLFTSVLGAYSVLLGLVQRSVSGQGLYVDLSMYDAALCLNEYHVTWQSVTGRPQPRGGYDAIVPFGSYRARDGSFSIQVATKGHWAAFCAVIGRPDLDRPDLDTGSKRYQTAREEITRALKDWAAGRTVREVVDALVGADIPASPVQDIDSILDCAHLAARGMLLEIDDPVVGPYRAVGNPITTPNLPQSKPRPAPSLGEHTEEVLSALAGLSTDQIAALRAQDVI